MNIQLKVCFGSFSNPAHLDSKAFHSQILITIAIDFEEAVLIYRALQAMAVVVLEYYRRSSKRHYWQRRELFET